MGLAEDDVALRKLGLPLNGSLEEGKPLPPEHELYMENKIKPKLKDPGKTLAQLDETSRVRIFNGSWLCIHHLEILQTHYRLDC